MPDQALKAGPAVINRLFTGGLWATLGKGVFLLSSLAVNALLTHLLSPEAVGAYYLMASIAAIGALVALLGMQHAVVRVVAGCADQAKNSGARRAFRGAFVVFLAGALLTGLIYALWLGRWLGTRVFDAPLLVSFSALTAAWIVLRGGQIFVSQGLRSYHQLKLGSIFDGTATTVIIMAGFAALLLVKPSIGLDAALMVTILALLTSLLIGGRYLRRAYLQTPAEAGIELRGVLRIGFPLFILSIAIPGLSEAHIWILGGAASEDQVAIYGVVNRLAKFVVISLIIVNEVIPSTIAQLWRLGDRMAIEKTLRTVATISAIPAILIVVVLAFAGGDLLALVFGEFYREGSTALLILVLAQAVNALSGSPGILLIMSDYQNVTMVIGIIAGILGLAISLGTVATHGVNGIATGAGTSIVVHNFLMWLYCRKRIGITTHMRFDIIRSMYDFANILKTYKKHDG